jgi:hypothetical protein
MCLTGTGQAMPGFLPQNGIKRRRGSCLRRRKSLASGLVGNHQEDHVDSFAVYRAFAIGEEWRKKKPLPPGIG